METMPLQGEDEEEEGEEEEKMWAVPTEVPCVELWCYCTMFTEYRVYAAQPIQGDVTPGRKIEKTC